MAHQSTSLSTTLTPEFHNIPFSDVIDVQSFYFVDAFWRSVKVFLTAYAGYDKLCYKLYTQKLDQWIQAMTTLYEVNPDFQFMLEVKKDVVKQQMAVIIGIKKIQGIHLCTNLRVVFTIGHMSTNETPLDMRTDKQNISVTLPCTFREFRRLRTRRRIVRITAIADSWLHTNEPLNEFSINFSEISAEGFEDWFDIGRGVCILIKIIVSVSNEPGSDDIWLSDFTVHSIYQMLITRCKDYESQSQKGSAFKHKSPANKSKITYIRKKVNPKHETAFWSDFKTVDDIMQRIRTQIVEKREQNYSQISDILSRRVKFVDLQISSYFDDDYEDVDPVCLCSEWCNWNAFGHYNPLFRQLMVCHNKLYMSDRTNIADIYLFCCSFVIHTAEGNTGTANSPQKAPVLRLLNEANHMRQLNYRLYFMTIQSYKDKYKNCVPSYNLLLALSYRILRDQKIIPEIILDSSNDPFSNICFENITIFYKVLNDLHLIIGNIALYVPRHLERFWILELDEISRQDYSTYIYKAYEKRITDHNPSHDYIFTEDLEYSSVLAKNDSQILVKQIKDRIHKFSLPVNPLNIRVNNNSIIGTFTGIYKILRIVDPMLPKAMRQISMEQVVLCFIKFDNDFDDKIRQSSFLFNTDFEDTSRGPIDLQNCQKYYLFYTLKLYFMAYGIQRHFMKSLLDLNYMWRSSHTKQVAQHFHFIYKLDQIIEEKYRNLYADPIFSLPQDISKAVTGFYADFWKAADHEKNPSITIEGAINSALVQYYRLYFWWNNDGNNKPKFVRILDTFYQMFQYIGDRSEHLYKIILESIETIQTYDYYLEVLDTLIYYLVKADCSLVVCAVAKFFKEINRLQHPFLCSHRISFSLTKPGWVPIIRTMFDVFDWLDAIKTSYIVFDDQNNRISNALTETQTLVKNIYISFYSKLALEWVFEIDLLYHYNVANQAVDKIIPLHLASGLSFVIAFITDFRRHAHHFRNKCNQYFRKAVTQQHQRTFHFCLSTVDEFLQDNAAIEKAEPFFANCWQNQLGYLFANMNNMTGAQLRIDLNEADNYYTLTVI